MREPLQRFPHHRVELPLGKSHSPIREKADQSLLRLLEYLLPIGQAKLYAGTFIRYSAIKDKDKHVAVQDHVPINVENSCALLLWSHRTPGVAGQVHTV